MIPAGKVPLSSSWGPEMTQSSPAQGHTAKTRGGVGVGLELEPVGKQGRGVGRSPHALGPPLDTRLAPNLSLGTRSPAGPWLPHCHPPGLRSPMPHGVTVSKEAWAPTQGPLIWRE